MINVFPAASRHSVDRGWLQSNFNLSFGDYYDPNNTSFGVLRVLNDDIIAGHRGFGAHPHREMEIVSIVLKGHLKHEDSAGHSAVTTFGGVQRMSAGTGIVHSEMNVSDEEVHILQLWFTPEAHGLEASYETTEYDIPSMLNSLLPVVSKQGRENVAAIHQDLTIYMSELEAGKGIDFSQQEGRRIYLLVIEGDVTLQGDVQLNRRDSARITDVSQLQIQSGSGAMFMLIDLP
jgi:redox-sensitive bicupin YhaK (pirin superfamily)